MMTPQEVIEKFYRAFAENDHQTISGLYHAEATFRDPVFGRLDAREVRAMWSMLLDRSKGNLKTAFEIEVVKGNEVKSRLTARYAFGKKQRPVVNRISSTFILEDGLIRSQVDRFNFWKWSGMALGMPGKLLGWTPYLKNKVHRESKKALIKFINS